MYPLINTVTLCSLAIYYPIPHPHSEVTQFLRAHRGRILTSAKSSPKATLPEISPEISSRCRYSLVGKGKFRRDHNIQDSPEAMCTYLCKNTLQTDLLQMRSLQLFNSQCPTRFIFAIKICITSMKAIVVSELESRFCHAQLRTSSVRGILHFPFDSHRS